jgi:hypothetical protein
LGAGLHQQKDTVDPQIIEQLAAFDQKYDEAFNNGDATLAHLRVPLRDASARSWQR